MFTISAVFSQASSVLGASGLLGVLAAYLTGQMTWQQAVPVAVAGVAAILFKDNTGLQGAVKMLASDVIAVEQKATLPSAGISSVSEKKEGDIS